MGNVCIGSDSNSQIFTLYGDYFQADTRTILAILRLGEIEEKNIIFKQVDSLDSFSTERKSFKEWVQITYFLYL